MSIHVTAEQQDVCDAILGFLRSIGKVAIVSNQQNFPNMC